MDAACCAVHEVWSAHASSNPQQYYQSLRLFITANACGMQQHCHLARKGKVEAEAFHRNASANSLSTTSSSTSAACAGEGSPARHAGLYASLMLPASTHSLSWEHEHADQLSCRRLRLDRQGKALLDKQWHC
jgi:hypothetical protein